MAKSGREVKADCEKVDGMKNTKTTSGTTAHTPNNMGRLRNFSFCLRSASAIPANARSKKLRFCGRRRKAGPLVSGYFRFCSNVESIHAPVIPCEWRYRASGMDG